MKRPLPEGAGMRFSSWPEIQPLISLRAEYMTANLSVDDLDSQPGLKTALLAAFKQGQGK